MNGNDGIEKIILAVAPPDFDDVIRSASVKFAAFDPWIDKRVESHLADPAGAARGGRVAELHDDPGGQTISLEQILGRELRHRWRHGPMPADDAPVHLRIGHVFEAAVLLVADAESVNERDPAWMAGIAKAAPNRFQHSFGNGVTGARAADHDRTSVANERRGVIGAEDGFFECGWHGGHFPRNTGRRFSRKALVDRKSVV